MTRTEDARRRWLILVVGTLAMTVTCMFQFGLAYLIPTLRSEGYSLQMAGVLIACPAAGVLLTLVAWGAAADRWGERLVLASGLGAGGLILLAALWVPGTWGLALCLALSGAACASILASGRLVLGWFARHERGLAMGIRQTSQPLGVAIAAATLPTFGAHGLRTPLLFLGSLLVAASIMCLLFVRDPARPAPAPGVQPITTSPYRTPMLYRIHAASALLAVSQVAVTTYALVFLTDVRGWTAVAAGRVLAIAQIGGALGRLGAGYWSDRTDSRLRPMRIIAIATGAGMLTLAAAAAAGWSLAVPVLLILGVLAVSTNSLAFTAVAEHAGAAWAGRALGIQATSQNTLGAAAPPVLATVIGVAGFATSFAAVAVFPIVAALLVPVAAEHLSAHPAAIPTPEPSKV